MKNTHNRYLTDVCTGVSYVGCSVCVFNKEDYNSPATSIIKSSFLHNTHFIKFKSTENKNI